MTRKQSEILMTLVWLLCTKFIALLETTQCLDFLLLHHISHENKDIRCFRDLNDQKNLSISALKLMLSEN